MCCLQGALVLMGYVIELEVDEVIGALRRTVGWPASLTRALVLLFASWFFHGALWWIIIRRFYSQAKNAKDCNNPMPSTVYTIVSVIVVGECLFFSGFGAVVVCQLVYLTRAVFSRGIQERVQVESFRQEFWLEATVAYYILSCGAKTLLGVCFVALVLNMPSADDHDTFPLMTTTPSPAA